MTSTIPQTLAALSNVGKAPVNVPMSPLLFPAEIARTVAERQSHAMTFADGQLSIHAVGPEAWQALQTFTRELLAATLSGQ